MLRRIKMILLATTTLVAGPAVTAVTADAVVPADTAVADAPDAGDSDVCEIVVTSHRTHAVATIDAIQIQKILPGFSPLKAIQTLPGVT